MQPQIQSPSSQRVTSLPAARRARPGRLRAGVRVIAGAVAALGAVLCGPAQASTGAGTGFDLPPAAVMALRDWMPDGDLPALLMTLAQTVPAPLLDLPPGALIERGGPLVQAFGPDVLSRLDATGSSLPMIVYRKEDGRLPAAFIVARYRKVAPQQLLERLAERTASIKHPLVDQFLDLTPMSPAPAQVAASWGPGAKVRQETALVAFRMPFGAGIFGLRDSFAIGDWMNVMLPSGVGFLGFSGRPMTAAERTRHAVIKSKKDKDITLDDTHFEAREYRLSSFLLPERGADGQLGTIHVYFVRLVPALKPGKDLSGNGSFARWLLARGAEDALIMPVKMIREEIRKALEGKQ